MPKKISRLRNCCPLNWTGVPRIVPCSLPQAISEPVVVSAPSMTSKPSAPRVNSDMRVAVHDELGDADQGGGDGAEGVRERGPLRHGRHRHPDGHERADDRADDQAGDDPFVEVRCRGGRACR